VAALILFVSASLWIWKDNQRLSGADSDKARTIASIRQAAMSFGKNVDELERRCNPSRAKAALASAEARLQTAPTPETSYHAARWQRIVAEVLLSSREESDRKEGYQLLQRAKNLLTSLRSKHPNYGGLDEEWTSVTGDESRLKSGEWTTGGVGMAAELIPPVLPQADAAYQEAMVEQRLGDLWIALGDPGKAVIFYEQALTRYDEALVQSPSSSLAGERATCQRLLASARASESDSRGFSNCAGAEAGEGLSSPK